MNDNKQQDSKTNDPIALPEEQLENIAGGGFGIGGAAKDIKVREDVKVRDDVKVKRDGYGLGG